MKGKIIELPRYWDNSIIGDEMPTNQELQVEQKKRLFQFLKLEKENKGTDVKGLDELIIATKAEMQQEDVAYVEKMVSQLK